MSADEAAFGKSLATLLLKAVSVCRDASLLRCTTESQRLEVNAHYLSILSSLRQMSSAPSA